MRSMMLQASAILFYLMKKVSKTFAAANSHARLNTFLGT